MSERQIIHTSSLFEVDKSFEDPRFMKVRINAMTTGINLNNSRFNLDCVQAAKDTFKNIPVLAHVIRTKDKDGNEVLDYGSHDMHIEEDEFHDGQSRIIYDEVVVGIIPETNDFEIVENESTGEYNVLVTALLYRDYGNYVCDILESRGGVTDVSMEIFCEDLSYDANDKCLDVGRMVASGVTLLGDACTPAMPGAHAETFSINNSDRHDQLIQIMQELKESLDHYMAAVEQQLNSRRKEEESQMDKFNELLARYGKTAEDITFEYDGLSDDALEAAFIEAFGGVDGTPSEENSEPQDDGGQSGDAETFDDDGGDSSDGDVEDSEEADAEEEESETEEDTVEEEQESDEDEDVSSDQSTDGKIELSLKIGDETMTTFATLTDQLNALFELVNSTYADQDGTFYSVDADPDKKYVYMFDFWDNQKAYRQSYKVKSDVYSLTGDRARVYSRYYTEDELKQIDSLNFELQQTKESLAKYEAEPKKIELLESSDYDKIKETPEYKELAKRDSYFAIDTEDLAKKLDDILLSYAKSNKLDFAAKEQTPEKKSDFFAFARIESNTSFLDGLLKK